VPGGEHVGGLRSTPSAAKGRHEHEGDEHESEEPCGEDPSEPVPTVASMDAGDGAPGLSSGLVKALARRCPCLLSPSFVASPGPYSLSPHFSRESSLVMRVGKRALPAGLEPPVGEQAVRSAVTTCS